MMSFIHHGAAAENVVNTRNPEHGGMSEEPERAEFSAETPDTASVEKPEPGLTIAERYTITEAVEQRPGMEIFLATAHPPEKWCPTCDSMVAPEGDGVFCEECGTELQPGHYRLTVWPEDAAPGGLDAFVMAAPYDESWQLPVEWLVWRGYRYLVQENPAGDRLDRVEASASRDEVIAWSHTLLDTVARLHEAGFAGFHPAMEDFVVTGYRRLKLLNWKGFAVYPQEGGETGNGLADARKSDLADLASMLTLLFIEGDEDATRSDGAALPPPLRVFLSDLAAGAMADAVAASTALQEALSPPEQTETPEVAVTPVTLRYLAACRSDVGKVRRLNEDSLAAMDLSLIRTSTLDTMGVYVVADGVGGHDAGEVASRVAVETLIRAVVNSLIDAEVDTQSDGQEERYTAILSEAVHAANSAVVEARRQHRANMNTTLTAALTVGANACVANVGDSRTYLFRQGRLQPVTTDHSVVARLVAIGMIKPDEVYTHPQRNAIYRALGDVQDFKVDTFVVPLLPDDRLILCSDGLWEMVRDPGMEEILGSAASPVDACDRLVSQANINGGEDNISVIVVQSMTYNG